MRPCGPVEEKVPSENDGRRPWRRGSGRTAQRKRRVHAVILLPRPLIRIPLHSTRASESSDSTGINSPIPIALERVVKIRESRVFHVASLQKAIGRSESSHFSSPARRRSGSGRGRRRGTVRKCTVAQRISCALRWRGPSHFPHTFCTPAKARN